MTEQPVTEQPAEQPKFERGSALSIFKSDRAEDMVALVLALVIAAIVVMFVPK